MADYPWMEMEMEWMEFQALWKSLVKFNVKNKILRGLILNAHRGDDQTLDKN